MQTPAADEYRIDFPVLYVALDWIEAHCVIPDGFSKGDPYLLADWQFWYFANHYRIKPNAPLPNNRRPAVGAPAFHYRRSQIVMPQKAGKGPLTAAQCCLEGAGPALFAGWAKGGERYDCREHGCGCGWIYEYAPGEPMGVPWPTPLIQITAFSEEQTFNIFGALKPMILSGPLVDVVPRVGEEFIRLRNDGKIDTVTSSNQSRLGQRITYVPQDETGIWLEANKMDHVAKTQRRGLAGMQGRSCETTNGWDPAENSVAQRTAAAALRRPDIFRLHRQAPANLSFTNKRERRKILRYVYAGSWWVDLDAIEAEAAELLTEDPANAMRFFGNMIVAGKGAWLPDGAWKRTEIPRVVAPGTAVAFGFDGSRTSDWTAIRLETADGYNFTPTYGPDKRPTWWDPSEWGGEVPRGEVFAAFDEIFRTYTVRRGYGDPYDWESELDDLATRYNTEKDERVFKWPTYRVIPMYDALVRFYNDLTSTPPRITHCGDAVATEHLANARKMAKPSDRYLLVKPDAHRKIDIGMAATLAHEAASDLHAENLWGVPSRFTRAKGRAAVG